MLSAFELRRTVTEAGRTDKSC